MIDADELIARLEAATKGSRELNALICGLVEGNGQPIATVGVPTYNPPRYFCNPRPAVDWIGYDILYIAMPYTTSLDAALTLWDTPALDRGYPRRGINLFYAVLPGGKQAWNADAWELKDGNSVIMRLGMGTHRCRPISACIAALRACAAEGKQP